MSLSLLELKTMNSAYYKMSTSLAAVDLKIVLRLSAALLLMNAALIRGWRSLIFLLSYAALNRGRRFVGGGTFSSKYGKCYITIVFLCCIHLFIFCRSLVSFQMMDNPWGSSCRHLFWPQERWVKLSFLVMDKSNKEPAAGLRCVVFHSETQNDWTVDLLTDWSQRNYW